MKFVRGHSSNRKGPLYKLDPETGCWVWQRTMFANGYGDVGARGDVGTRVAHRMVYEQHKGSVPEGMQLDHLCRNRACVNPDHLEPVTGEENIRRGNVAILDKPQVKKIRSRHAAFVRDLAEEYGVGETTIRAAITNTTWKGV